MGAALAFSLYELARHPDIQELVVQELNEVFGNDDRTPSLSDLRRLTYLEQCIKETLRLYPSVPLMFRTLTEDTKLGTADCICSGFSVHQRSLPGLRQPATGPYSEPNKSSLYTLSCLFKIRFSFILQSPFRTSWLPLPFKFFYQTFACIPCCSRMLYESSLQFSVFEFHLITGDESTERGKIIALPCLNIATNWR